MPQFFHAFISYGRRDSKAFAIKLTQRLEAENLCLWFDQNDIPPAVDWQEQIKDGIERSHNFIFIITPYSVQSRYCRQEIELACRYHKRVIPLLQVNADAEYAQMHPIIRERHWLSFEENSEQFDFEASLAELLVTLRQDADYVQKHTQHLVSALVWASNHYKPKYLLVEEELIEAQSWLKIKFEGQQPPCTPSDLHCEYICESIKYENNLIAQAFIAAPPHQQIFSETLAKTLHREAITVWQKKEFREQESFDLNNFERIEKSSIFLLVLDALPIINNQFFEAELEFALANKKRIIIIACQANIAQNLPKSLSEREVVFFKKEQVGSSKNQLVKKITTNQDYLNFYSHLLWQAKRWKYHNQESLLRGLDLQKALFWQGQTNLLNPQLTSLQMAYINASAKKYHQEKISKKIIKVSLFIVPLLFTGLFFYVRNQIIDNINNVLDLYGLTYAENDERQEAMFVEMIEAADKFYFSPFMLPQQPDDLKVRFISSLLNELYSLRQIGLISHQGEVKDFDVNSDNIIISVGTGANKNSFTLKNAQRISNYQVSEQGESINRITFGYDNKNQLFALATEPSNDLQVWLIDKGIPQKIFTQEKVHEERIDNLVFSYENRILASGSLDGKIKLWNLEDGTLINQSLSHERGISSITFSKDNQLLASSSYDGSLKIWDLKGNLIKTISKAHNDAIIHLSFSPDSQIIASSSFDGTAKLWTRKGDLITTLSHRPDGQSYPENSSDKYQYLVYRINFSSDGNYLATGSFDRTVKLWKIKDDGLQHLHDLNQDGRVYDLAFAPATNHHIIAVAGEMQAIKLWYFDDDNYLLLDTFSGHQKGVNKIKFSHQGDRLISSSFDGTVRIWSLSGLYYHHVITPHPKQLPIVDVYLPSNLKSQIEQPNLFSAIDISGENHWYQLPQDLPHLINGPYIITKKSKLKSYWQTDSNNECEKSNEKTTKLNEDIIDLSYTQIDRDVAIALITNYYELKLFKTRADGHPNCYNNLDINLATIDNNLQANRDKFKPQKVKISFERQNNRILVAVSDNNQLKILTIGEPKNLGEDRWISLPINNLSSFNFSADGHLLTTGQKDGTISIWSSQDGQWEREVIAREKAAVNHLVFDSNNKYLISAISPNNLKIWTKNKFHQWKLKKIIASAHNQDIVDMMVSPNNKTLASLSADGKAKLWNLEGNLLMELIIDGKKASHLRFSNDNKFIFVVDRDKVRLWRLPDNILNPGSLLVKELLPAVCEIFNHLDKVNEYKICP